jgi:hypothetical protein
VADAVTLRLGMGVDATDFAGFAKALRKAAPDLAKLLRTNLRAVGSVAADEARGIAGEVSTSIPPTIKVRVSGATVAIVAGGKENAIAGLFELGNKPNRRSPGDTFGHPVFGNKQVWSRQATHPFLAPAVTNRGAEVEAGALDALDDVIARVVNG